MDLATLRATFRTETGDKREPYLFDSDDIDLWLNEAQTEAAIRGRLIYETDNDDICEIAVTAGTSTYTLHVKLYEIMVARFQKDGDTEWTELPIRSRKELDRLRPGWRDETEDVRDLIQDDKTIRFGCIPVSDGTLRLEGYRLPRVDMEDDDDTPEIHAMHHRQLVDWALFRAYLSPDAETNDPKRAYEAETRFTRYFGAKPDADGRRLTQHDTPHHNQLW